MLLVLYSRPVKPVVTFLLLVFAFLFTYTAVRSTYPEGHHLRRHIDYSGLEGTKGGASAIRRSFADNQLI